MWDRDPVCEQLLADIGVKFEYKTSIPISKLRVNESKRLNARPNETLDESMCYRYAAEMKKGKRFPAIVIREDNLIIGGNNRINAAQQAGRTHVDAYILNSPTQQQQDEFIRRDNIRHGKPLTEDEKISTCVELHRKYGTSILKLCDNFFGGDESAYRRILTLDNAYEMREKLEMQGVAARSKIPQNVLATLYPLRKNNNLLREVGMLVAAHGLSQIQCTELISKIKAKGTESEGMTVIADMRTELTHKARSGPRKIDPVKCLIQTLTRIKTALLEGNNGKKFPDIDKITEDKEERKALREEITEIINILRNIKKA